MATDAASETSNPFADRPARSDSSSAPADPDELESPSAVLVVDRNATLTLGTDALIVLDEGLRHKRQVRNGCGLLPQLSKTTRAIPFYNILWAELLNGFDVAIHYAHTTGGKACQAGLIHYTVLDKTQHEHASKWIEALMQRAYPPSVKRRKRVKVLVNPFGGQGYAQKMWTSQIEPIFAAAKMAVEVEKTTSQGHAVEIAQKLDIDAFDVVACASGDGLPHEVFNGLAKHAEPARALRQVAVVQLPCGSGNAMSWNLNGTDSPSLAALAIVKGIRTPLDLMAITQGNNQYYSFLSQSVGIIAESDLGTESLRWMGSFRFTWGILVRLFSRTCYPATVSVANPLTDKAKIKSLYHTAITQPSPPPDFPTSTTSSLSPLKYGTIKDPLPSSFTPPLDLPDLGNFYVGNMVWMAGDAAFFAPARPSDGKMDMMNISAYTSRLTALRMLTTVGEGTMMEFPQVHYSKVDAYRIIPRSRADGPPSRRKRLLEWLGGNRERGGGLIAVDGERVPFEPFQVEVMRGLGTVLCKSGTGYEFDPTKFLGKSVKKQEQRGQGKKGDAVS